jgi:hypothetical protein
MMPEYVKPTAKKQSSSCEWYDPAVTTAYGPKVFPNGERHGTRYGAMKEARRLIAEAMEDTPPRTPR